MIKAPTQQVIQRLGMRRVDWIHFANLPMDELDVMFLSRLELTRVDHPVVFGNRDAYTRAHNSDLASRLVEMAALLVS
jgi:hypothetical protein